jgi:hypothetical protein
MLMALLCRVEIRFDRIDITLSRCRLTELLTGSLDLKMPHRGLPTPPGDLLTLSVSASLKRVGREMRILVANADDQTPADPSLLRILARAHHVQTRLIQNPTLSVHDIAQEEHVLAAYLYTPRRLPWLAPDITSAIINRRKPPQLTAQTLMRLTPRLPIATRESMAPEQLPLPMEANACTSRSRRMKRRACPCHAESVSMSARSRSLKSSISGSGPIRGDDGALYILRLDEKRFAWSLTLFTSPKAQALVPQTGPVSARRE